ncbi:acyl-CoA dehydrogenase family protein [Mycolicibacterium stellerae]|uniref:acyl-CoA dehydrogenase family protein n=1 Tax=Mycolicibacterium stellerae TaxID=2358193 RepID=UPI000F0B14CB|nr:acyl-CoA dehydrogenase family protein [Mycolicibacterium stellerae]
MTYTLSAEQLEMSAAVADFLDKRSPESEVRRLMEAGGAPDPAVWAQLTDQLGLTGLLIPHEYGGGGFGFLDFALVAEKTGASLLVAPLLSTVMASCAVVLSSSEELKAQWLPALASGKKTVTLALAEESGSWDASAVTTTVSQDEGALQLTGTKMYVIDGQHADLFIVSAVSADGSVGLYAVRSDSSGVELTALETLDQTRPQARVRFEEVPAVALTDSASGAATLERVVAIAGVLLSAEQVGGAQRCLDMAVEYAKVRVQFGRPIGSFQAIKHKCADMLLDVESARSAAYHAAAVLDGHEDPAIASTLASAHCSTTYTKVAGENIQIHGGIGFTWEHPAHLYYKRAKTSELLFGDPAWSRERLAVLVGI